MHRKIVLVAAVVGAGLVVGCTARTELTREDRVEKLRKQASQVDEERWGRTQVAMRQTHDDLKSAPVKPEPAPPKP